MTVLNQSDLMVIQKTPILSKTTHTHSIGHAPQESEERTQRLDVWQGSIEICLIILVCGAVNLFKVKLQALLLLCVQTPAFNQNIKCSDQVAVATMPS